MGVVSGDPVNDTVITGASLPRMSAPSSTGMCRAGPRLQTGGTCGSRAEGPGGMGSRGGSGGWGLGHLFWQLRGHVNGTYRLLQWRRAVPSPHAVPSHIWERALNSERRCRVN